VSGLPASPKAFSGAVALSLVSQESSGSLTRSGGECPRCPGLAACHATRVAAAPQRPARLQRQQSTGTRLQRAPHQAILPGRLLHYVWHEPLQFRPGSRYKYDNSDNVATAMMARAAADRSYRALLRILVYRPARIRHTSLPAGFRLPRPYLHGYSLERGQPAQDVSEALTASVAWATGGMVSTRPT